MKPKDQFDDEAEKMGNTKHGMRKLPEYRAWMNMRSRCSNPKDNRYSRYGARGIRVCKRWDDFKLFLSDVGRRPGDEFSIERINNDGNYEPGNCRWATRKEQGINTSTNRHITAFGRRMTIQQWADETKIGRNTLAWRLNAGWSHNRIVSQSVHHAAIDAAIKEEKK